MMRNAERYLPALGAVCDALIPAIPGTTDAYGRRRASDMEVAERILRLSAELKAEDQAELCKLLRLLASPALGLTWMGPLKPASALSPAQLTAMLHAWADSPFNPLRMGFQTLRKLSALLFYAAETKDGGLNPNAAALGYAVPAADIPCEETPLRTTDLYAEGGDLIRCQTLVIGSGCGGSVVAARLAQAGQDILILEKGAYHSGHEMSSTELRAYSQLFEAGGLAASNDGGIALLAGATVGGGGTINWAGSLRTPEYVLREWAETYDNPHFADPGYAACFEAIERRNAVNTRWPHNRPSQLLAEGAARLGLKATRIPHNMTCPDYLSDDEAWRLAGFSCLGDRYGIKQGPTQTFLRDAIQAGARLSPHTRALRILIENGAAVGALVSCASGGGASPERILTIRADRVVVSAGALHTPVLLRKSGLRHPQIGQNLYLHPVSIVPGYYPEATLPWQGPMMTALVDDWARLDRNWGVRIENPPAHPGLTAAALNWESGPDFKQTMLRLPFLSPHICLTRDRFGGRVRVGKRSGQPVASYRLHPYDRAHLIRGMQESARLHAAAGAEQISILHQSAPLHWHSGEDIERFVAQIPRLDWSRNRFGLFSAHQMGTCRMGGRADCPVKPNGETREARHLYVADTSLFPSASGANPMLSAQALAWYVAGEIGGR